jgi:hypothetical protein
MLRHILILSLLLALLCASNKKAPDSTAAAPGAAAGAPGSSNIEIDMPKALEKQETSRSRAS